MATISQVLNVPVSETTLDPGVHVDLDGVREIRTSGIHAIFDVQVGIVLKIERAGADVVGDVERKVGGVFAENGDIPRLVISARVVLAEVVAGIFIGKAPGTVVLGGWVVVHPVALS